MKDRTSNALFDRIIKELNIVTQPFIAVAVNVPEGTTFGFLMKTMASRLSIAVDLGVFRVTLGFKN